MLICIPVDVYNKQINIVIKLRNKTLHNRVYLILHDIFPYKNTIHRPFYTFVDVDFKRNIHTNTYIILYLYKILLLLLTKSHVLYFVNIQ